MIAVERVPIRHEIVGGAGTLEVPGAVYAEMEPFRGAGNVTTTLRDPLFSTVPGSPAYVGKASINRVELPQYGVTWSFEGGNAIQSDYHIAHREG